MTVIQNHRALRRFISKQQLLASEEKSMMDLLRVHTFFNGVAIQDIVEKLGNEEDKQAQFNAACAELFKRNIDENSQTHYREFLRYYLHQQAIYHKNIKFIIFRFNESSYCPIDSETEYKVNLYLKGNDLYIEDEFFIKGLVKGLNALILKPKKHSYFIHGKTQFKIAMTKQNGECVPKLFLLQSTLDCPDPYFKKLLDDRNFLHILIDFIKGVFGISTSAPITTFNFANEPILSKPSQVKVPASAVTACSN
jgi:hypothetical protein